MPSREEREKAMESMANMMIDAGALAVIGVLEGGAAVLMLADGFPRLEVVGVLREMADTIESDQIKLTGQVSVEREDDDE